MHPQYLVQEPVGLLGDLVVAVGEGGDLHVLRELAGALACRSCAIAVVMNIIAACSGFMICAAVPQACTDGRCWKTPSESRSP